MNCPECGHPAAGHHPRSGCLVTGDGVPSFCICALTPVLAARAATTTPCPDCGSEHCQEQ